MLFSQGFPAGATVGYAKSQVRDILKGEFNKSVELQVSLLNIFPYILSNARCQPFFAIKKNMGGKMG